VPREEGYGLQLPRTRMVYEQAAQDVDSARTPAERYGAQTRRALAGGVAFGADVGEQVGSAASSAAETVGAPIGRFAYGLFGSPAHANPYNRSGRGRTPAPAPEGATPATTRPNPAPAEPAQLKAPGRATAPAQQFPYGVDLGRLKSMFPQASDTSIPASLRNGMALREAAREAVAQQFGVDAGRSQPQAQAQAQAQARPRPRAPQRADDKDLQRGVERLLGGLRHTPTGGGGFGDLLRYRLALGQAGLGLVPIAAERARRDAAYDRDYQAYDDEQQLGVQLRKLGLEGDELDLARQALDYKRPAGGRHRRSR